GGVLGEGDGRRYPEGEAGEERLLHVFSLEGCPHGELKRRLRREQQGVRVIGIDQAERDVENGHHEAQLGTGGNLERAQVDVVRLQEDLAGVDEEEETDGADHVEVLLRAAENVI